MNIPENLHGIVSTLTFTHPCKWCGSTVEVVDSETQPHRCRIELEAAK